MYAGQLPNRWSREFNDLRGEFLQQMQELALEIRHMVPIPEDGSSAMSIEVRPAGKEI